VSSPIPICAGAVIVCDLLHLTTMSRYFLVIGLLNIAILSIWLGANILFIARNRHQIRAILKRISDRRKIHRQALIYRRIMQRTLHTLKIDRIYCTDSVFYYRLANDNISDREIWDLSLACQANIILDRGTPDSVSPGKLWLFLTR